jgi:hypothetical protein
LIDTVLWSGRFRGPRGEVAPKMAPPPWEQGLIGDEPN